MLAEDLTPIEPGSGAIGRVAQRGHVPLGYYKDEQKTKESFVTIDGERWVLLGDAATIEADGTIAVLGRHSVCINTGGEKVYPEEVEAALKAHPAVYDAVVAGVPDERYGQRVAALVQIRPEQRRAEPGGARRALPDPGRGLQGAAAGGRRARDPSLAERQGRLSVGVEGRGCRIDRAGGGIVSGWRR